jgi:hypothetical protein
MEISYTLKEIHPGIFAVIMNDSYQRAMLFLRSQEHYESSFPEIRGKHFDIFDFMDRYRRHYNSGTFTYPKDWSGFNVPGQVVEKCTKHVLDARNGLFPTPYDYIMKSILDEVKEQNKGKKRFYLIGVDKLNSKTMDHEIAHGLFYVDPKYKAGAMKLVRSLKKTTYSQLSKIILDMGYCKEVVDDEIQAYLSTGIASRMQSIKGIDLESEKFSEHFKSHGT